jgi:hypothetical protein
MQQTVHKGALVYARVTNRTHGKSKRSSFDRRHLVIPTLGFVEMG